MQFVRKVSLVALVIASTVAWATTASADIILTAGNVPQTDENVLLGTGVTGNPIFGETNQTHLAVRFTGMENLTAPANGQARVEAADGTLNYLKIDIVGGSYTSLIFNLNAETSGTVSFRAVDTMGDVFNFANVAVAAGGQNFSTFTTILGQRISFIEFTTGMPATVTFDDVRQVRIGGARLDIPTDVPQVPEPASMLLFGTGLAGLAAARRRRTAAK